MTTYANVGHIILKRGNTSQSTAYTGPVGELTFDTGLFAVRVHNGVTPGGNVVLENGSQFTANLGTAATNITTLFANAATQTTLINTINANIIAVNAAIITANTTQSNQITVLQSQLTGANAAIVTANTALKSYTDNQISTAINNLVDSAPGTLDTLAEIAANLLSSNSAIGSIVNSITSTNANVTAANAAIVTANTAMKGYVDAVTTAWTSNAASQAGSITTLQTQVYADANVASYLPTYTGNIAGNIVKSGYTWTFSNTGTTTFPTGVTLSNARGANTVNFTTAIDKSFQIETQTSTTGRLWSFGTDGNLTLPQIANINFSNGVSILAGITGTYSNANVATYLPTYTGNIAGNISKNGNVWTFGTNGTTTFPTNISVDYSGGNVQFPRIIADTGKAFSVQGQGNIGSAALAWTVDPDAASQYAAVFVSRAGGDNLAKVVLQAQSDSGDAATAKTWQFNQTGTTRFPSSQILAPAGESITMQSDNYSQLMWENANVTVAPNMAINSNFYVAQNNATLDIGYRDGSSTQLIKTWLWSVDGGMSFPDTTTQYTAFSNAAVATYLANYDGGINFTASPAVITGLGNISSANFTFANGVNILSTVTDLYTNAATQQTSINNINANIGGYYVWANANVAGLYNSILGANTAWTANAASQAGLITTLQSNAGVQADAITSLTANAGAQADAITGANTTISTLQANVGSFYTWANTNFGTSSYGNTNANALLSSNTISTINTTGDIKTIANVIGTNFTFANGVNILSTATGLYSNNTVFSYMPTYGGNIAGNIVKSGYTWRFGTDGNLTIPENINFANGVNILSTATGLYSNNTVFSYMPTYGGNIAGNIVKGGYTYRFGTDGNLTLPETGYLRVGAGITYANGTSGATRFESSWTVPTGNSTQSFTVTPNETYYMWVDCNITNGILAWNATATVTNTNVPVVGAQYAWVYNGGGTPIDFTSIPNQFVGTGNTIVRSSVSPSATTNVFDFGINNTSGGNVTVRYGWVAIS